MRQTRVFLGLALFCALGFAAETAPATAPATAAATMPAPNWSTPKDAYLTYIRAYHTMDGLTLQKSVAWEDPADGARIAHRAESKDPWMSSAVEALDLLLSQYPDDALVTEYVKQTRVVFDAPEKSRAQVLAAIEKGASDIQEKIDGDNAAVTFMKDQTYKLRKIDGRWLLLPESIPWSDAPRDDATRKYVAMTDARTLRFMQLKKQAYTAFMADLKARKFAAAREAVAAVQKIDQEAVKKAYAEMDANQAPPPASAPP